MCFPLCSVSASSAQMLVLTYEAAGVDRLYPYFNHRFAPLNPIMIFGRYAKGEPICPPSHAVWYAWQDSTCSHLTFCIEQIELSAFFYSTVVRFSDAVTFLCLRSPCILYSRTCIQLCCSSFVSEVSMSLFVFVQVYAYVDACSRLSCDLFGMTFLLPFSTNV